MNIFKQLLEIKTWNVNLEFNKIHLDDFVDWDYCYYYYDLKNHSLYINNLDKKFSNKELENIINLSYKTELEKSNIISKIDKPKVYLFYYTENKKLAVIDSLDLRAIRKKSWEILKLKVWM